jgi:superfamily II DNA or RNA helicase
MARAAASPPRAPSEPRLIANLERVFERARGRADSLIDQARRTAGGSHESRCLAGVEAELRDLRAGKEDLSEYGRQCLREAQEARERLRRRLAEIRAPMEEEAEAILTQVEKARRLLRRALRQVSPRDRVEGVLAACEAVSRFQTLREYEVLVAAQRAAETVAAAPPPEAEPEVESEPAAGPRLPEPLPPTALEVAELPRELLGRAANGPWDPASHYILNRQAQELSLVKGFDTLIAPQSARGLAEYPHQIETVRLVLRRMRGRALLCDEVGLGKTIEAGLIAKEYALRGLVRRILTLVPPSLAVQWQEEMADKFGLQFILNTDPEFRQTGPEAWRRFDRIIASLHTAKLPAHRSHVIAQDFDLIVVDEAHHLRSRSTLAWKFCNELKKKYVLLITATPVQNNLDELFNLITVLAPGQLQTTAAFRKEFVTRGDPRMPRNRERLRQLLSDVMVRNSRSQMHLMLPPRTAHTHRLTLGPQEESLYRGVTTLVRQEYGSQRLDRFTALVLQQQAGSSMAAIQAGAESIAARRGQRALCRALIDLANQAREVRQESKAAALLALLDQTGDQVLLFTHFRRTQVFLAHLLAEAGISHSVLSGDISPAERERAVAEFAGGRRVLLSTDVGSEGRNLQFCQTLINYDLPWNPMRIEQRVGRIHRIGQKEEVHIDNLCAAGTIESHILEVLDAKLNMFQMVVGEIGVVLGNLEAEDEFEELALDIWIRAANDEEAGAGFAHLADRLLAARARYLEARDYDEALFGEEFAAASG